MRKPSYTTVIIVYILFTLSVKLKWDVCILRHIVTLLLYILPFTFTLFIELSLGHVSPNIFILILCNFSRSGRSFTRAICSHIVLYTFPITSLLSFFFIFFIISVDYFWVAPRRHWYRMIHALQVDWATPRSWHRANRNSALKAYWLTVLSIRVDFTARLQHRDTRLLGARKPAMVHNKQRECDLLARMEHNLPRPRRKARKNNSTKKLAELSFVTKPPPQGRRKENTNK